MAAFNIFNLSDEHITVMEALRGVEVEGAVLVTTPQVGLSFNYWVYQGSGINCECKSVIIDLLCFC